MSILDSNDLLKGLARIVIKTHKFGCMSLVALADTLADMDTNTNQQIFW